MIDAQEHTHVDADLGDQDGGEHQSTPGISMSRACWTR
jgi:hypothetical protein